jgi:hypothetical protein
LRIADQRLAAERPAETLHQEGSAPEPVEIEVDCLRKPLGVRVQDHHLAGAHQDGLTQDPFEVNPHRPFEDQVLRVRLGVIFHDHGRARDGGGDGGGLHLGAAGSFRNTKQNSAPAEVHGAGTFVEAENGVCSQASNGQIPKGEFGARICSSAHRGIAPDLVAHRRRPRLGLAGKEFHVPDNLSDLRFPHGFATATLRPNWE